MHMHTVMMYSVNSYSVCLIHVYSTVRSLNPPPPPPMHTHAQPSSEANGKKQWIQTRLYVQ
jgi:hypothetical protein